MGANKIAVNKDYAKFRKKGIHPELESKLDTMFGDTVVTGEYTFTPEVHEEFVADFDATADLGANEESDIPMVESNETMHAASSSRPSSGSKRGKNNVGASLLRDNMIEMRDFLESQLTDAPGYSMDEVIEDVRSLPGLDDTSELFYFACSLFRDQRNRSVWKYLKTAGQKMRWLTYMKQTSTKFIP